MRNICPKCEKDIYQELYEEFMEDLDFHKVFTFDCPHCGTILEVSMEWNFIVQEKSVQSDYQQETEGKK